MGKSSSHLVGKSGLLLANRTRRDESTTMRSHRTTGDTAASQAVRLNIMSDAIAVYCRSGHYMGTFPEDTYRGLYPGRLKEMMQDQYLQEVERQNYCTKCGEPSLIACPSCDTVILDGNERPSYCGNCRKPFPWTERELSTTEDGGDEFEPLGG